MKRPSPAMVVALAALVVALGGTATAGTLITSREVRDDSLTGRDIKNGSIGRVDLQPSLRRAFGGQPATGTKDPSIVVLAGPPGPTGPSGSQGIQGPAGPSGGINFSKIRAVYGPDVVLTPGPNVVTASSYCPTGWSAVGGGGLNSVAHLGLAGPLVDNARRPIGWQFAADGEGLTDPIVISAIAICVEQ